MEGTKGEEEKIREGLEGKRGRRKESEGKWKGWGKLNLLQGLRGIDAPGSCTQRVLCFVMLFLSRAEALRLLGLCLMQGECMRWIATDGHNA